MDENRKTKKFSSILKEIKSGVNGLRNYKNIVRDSPARQRRGKRIRRSLVMNFKISQEKILIERVKP